MLLGDILDVIDAEIAGGSIIDDEKVGRILGYFALNSPD